MNAHNEGANARNGTACRVCMQVVADSHHLDDERIRICLRIKVKRRIRIHDDPYRLCQYLLAGQWGVEQIPRTEMASSSLLFPKFKTIAQKWPWKRGTAGGIFSTKNLSYSLCTCCMHTFAQEVVLFMSSGRVIYAEPTGPKDLPRVCNTFRNSTRREDLKILISCFFKGRVPWHRYFF
jgi:hypothetical protein